MKKTNLYLSLLIFLVSVTSYLLPNFYDPWRTVYHDFLTFCAFSLLFLKVLLDHVNIQINHKILVIFTISFIPLIQNLFGKIYFFGDAFLVFIYIFSFGLAAFIGFNLRRNHEFDKILKFISAIAICAGLISSFIMLKQWLLLTNGGIWLVDVPPNGRPFANFAQPNNCASFLLLSSLATLYLFEKRIINYISGISLTCLFIFCLALTQSRTVWVFIVCFIIWWGWKSTTFSIRLGRYSIAYYVSFFTLAVIVLPYLSSFLGVLSASDIVTRATTGHLRFPMWQQMLVAISNEPVWGYGWNQVSVAQISAYIEFPTREWTEHSHNIILDLLIWNGIPIGLLIIGFFTFWLWQLSKITRNVEIFISLSMIGVLIVHGMLEYALEYAFFLLPVGLFLGLVTYDQANKKILSINRELAVPILLGSIALFYWIFSEYRLIEKDTRMVQFELKNIGTEHAQHAAPDIILLSQLRERLRFLRTEPRKNMTNEEMNWMKQVTYRYGTAINLHRYAQALALNGQIEAAGYYLQILNNLHQVNVTLESLYLVDDSLSYQWKKVVKP